VIVGLMAEHVARPSGGRSFPVTAKDYKMTPNTEQTEPQGFAEYLEAMVEIANRNLPTYLDICHSLTRITIRAA
jgi:hypothetical protein